MNPGHPLAAAPDLAANPHSKGGSIFAGSAAESSTIPVRTRTPRACRGFPPPALPFPGLAHLRAESRYPARTDFGERFLAARAVVSHRRGADRVFGGRCGSFARAGTRLAVPTTRLSRIRCFTSDSSAGPRAGRPGGSWRRHRRRPSCGRLALRRIPAPTNQTPPGMFVPACRLRT